MSEYGSSQPPVGEDAVGDGAVGAGETDRVTAQGAGPRPTPTPVAAALRELESLGERDLAEHPDVYQRIHAELQAALATIDNA